ncbi:inorganic pyrophosphatase [Podospora aff. communis PSN243]|uniref:inorganic diphosphatase n=1 Tax=Podospora aff. communis PSN243 TaxID=3040156 RepID=A0AAV9GAR2_9PEZI|nr:inorganic pyrophosphatase [Podospora aff. communis PSN243]
MDPQPHPVTKSEYTLHKHGRPFTTHHRIYFEHLPSHTPISPVHDIPLLHHRDHPNKIYNMVVEIPRWSNPKFEISLATPFNPIIQDTLPFSPPTTPPLNSSPSHSESKSHLRFQPSIHPFTGTPFNYGALPQTWEDPFHADPLAGIRGDNDPLDACEVGRRISYTGEVKRVKVLGVLGLVDQGEMDWKVVVVDVEDEMAGRVEGVEDLEGEMPGLLDGIRDWFRIYKIPDGGEANDYAFGGEFKGREFAEQVIEHCHRSWRELVMGEVKHAEASLKNTTLIGTPGKMDPDDVDFPAREDLSPAPIEADLDVWHFIDRDKLKSGLADSLEQSKLKIDLQLK